MKFCCTGPQLIVLAVHIVQSILFGSLVCCETKWSCSYWFGCERDELMLLCTGWANLKRRDWLGQWKKSTQRLLEPCWLIMAKWSLRVVVNEMCTVCRLVCLSLFFFLVFKCEFNWNLSNVNNFTLMSNLSKGWWCTMAPFMMLGELKEH